MAAEVRIPTLGESVTEGVIVRWIKKEGDSVKTDEPLLELETDKASVEVPAVRGGVLHIVKPEGATVQVGEVVATIDGAATSTASATPPPVEPAKPASPPATPPADLSTVAGKAPSAIETGLSPAVRKLVAEHDIQPDQIAATGRGGRITKADVLAHIEKTVTPEEQAPADPTTPAAPTPPVTTAPVSADVERVPMTHLRRRIAERLVQAQHTAAILTTFNEVDMTNVMDLRARHKERFKQVHGVSLGFMSFFARACIHALRDVPVANAQIDGNDVVYHKHVHLGVAVGTERGLVVPVVHNADLLSFAEVEKEIERLAGLARISKLGISDLSGGTFTISNGGVYGSLMSTPILNPPQAAILGMHKIEKRPVVVGDQIVIRPMMYLAVSYDHRLIDGEHAVTFLVRIKERLEDPTRLLFDV